MSRFIIILVLLVWLACPAPQGGAVGGHLSIPLGVFAGGYGLLIGSLALWGRHIAARVHQQGAGQRSARFHRALNASRWMVLAWFAYGTYWLGWKSLVDHLLQSIPFYHNWQPQCPSLLIGSCPALAAWVGLCCAQYAVDAAQRRPHPLPLRDYLLSHLRLQILFIVAPMLILVLLRDVLMVAVGSTLAWLMKSPPAQQTLEFALAIPTLAAVLLPGPEILRRVLKTRPLPPTPLRQRLQTLCQRHGIAYADMLLWQTSHQIANALVMGLVARWRYILISDLLLDQLSDDQIEAVFAHEIGHVKHHHLYWLTGCVIGVLLSLSVAADCLCNHYPRLGDSDTAQLLVLLPLGAGVFALVFGYVSRTIERQADVFAARALTGTAGQAVDPTSVAIFASALQRVAQLSDIDVNSRSWDHGSIISRLNFLTALSQAPALTTRYDRQMRRFYRLTAIALATAALVLAVYLWLGGSVAI